MTLSEYCFRRDEYMNNLTLGITTIGDLLLNDRISEVGGGKSIDGIRLVIPEYQRPYKWTAKNTNQLLDDIEEAMNENKEVYRVGTLILHKDNDDNYNIVDGQQRTITFALLLDCLGESYIRFLEQRLADNSYNLRNVLNNHNTLKRRLEKLWPEEKDRDKLKGFIKDQCELIVVITEDLSEAFQFFDSQNARGKALYPHDLLKAYHLREMRSINAEETERTVRMWEELDQKNLSVLFNEYLYRLKEWVKGNRAYELTEHNIDLFKGVTKKDNHPYAQFYKSAYAYAEELNRSNVPFVTGIQELNPFQLNAPIIAGQPFFQYTKHYFDILADIQNNDKYEGYFINDVDIVKTLDLREYRNGVGNRITRLMFDTAILLYVDRFCPAVPSRTDIDYLNQFVLFAFVWAYSLRAQYRNVGWLVAQNYIMGTSGRTVKNGFNMYKVISESDSPSGLLSKLADRVVPLSSPDIVANKDNIDEQDEDGVYQNYLHYFAINRFWEDV